MYSKKFTLLLFLLAFFCISCGNSPKNPGSTPELSGIGCDGEHTSFHFSSCKATLISFGASWCLPCKIDHEFLAKSYDSFKQNGFCLLHINADDSPEIMKNYLNESKIPFKALHWNYEIMNHLGNPNLLPTYFMVNNKGDIKVYHKGLLGKKSIQNLLDSLKQAHLEIK